MVEMRGTRLLRRKADSPEGNDRKKGKSKDNRKASAKATATVDSLLVELSILTG
jgi:hypothetical protein